MTKWTLFILIVNVLTSQSYGKTTKISSKLYNDRERRSPEFEETLRQFRGLLKDPIDEEHDDLKNESDDTHAREWTLQLSADDDQLARKLANKYGFDHFSRVEGVGSGVYRFVHDGSSKKSEESIEITEKLKEESDTDKIVSKREHIEAAKQLAGDGKVLWYKRERILSREKRMPVEEQKSEARAILNDPRYEEQWYINNEGQTAGPASFDSNVLKAWKRGYTGKGVTVSVLDDGMDHTHPELVDNYDPEASKDLNGNDDDPFPNDSIDYNAHGTKCSGTIAAKANNSICGVGIAYDANIGAIRMLDGKATDGLEADALSFHRNHIDIYSCSWGPKDNGQVFGRPGKLGRIALAQGTKFGRNGLGSLFIWATGNGGMMTDDCNADGYVNSIHTLGIGSVNEHGVSTYYGERCPAMFAVTYCSGQHSNLGFTDLKANVITTFLHHKCTDHFVGTSSAAPLAAGIFSLVLQANPKLTWRDVQHLVFHTAKQTSPLDEGWSKNGCGKWFNHKFGFGVLDADLLVQDALNWTTVPKQRSCHFKLNFENGDIPHRHHFALNFTTDGCQSCKKKADDGKCKNGIAHLEHVIVNVTLKHRRRGDLSIDMISPSGTVSHLLHTRAYDCSSSGLKGWLFMTLFNWCENPKGTWQLIFKDNENGMVSMWEKKSQDKEEEYIRILDAEKKEEMEKRHENLDSESMDDTATVETKTEKQIYNDMTDREEYNMYKRRLEDTYRTDKRNDEYDQYNRRYYDNNNYRYNSYRKRRDADFTDDKTDYVLYKKNSRAQRDNCGQNDLKDNKVIAGEVKGISVTFYGSS